MPHKIKPVTSKALQDLLEKQRIAEASKMNLVSMTIQTYTKMCLDMHIFRFVIGLPFVDLAIIPPNEQTCGLCQKPLCSKNDWKIHGEEIAVALPCGHIYGHFCMRNWFSPYEKHQTGCPTIGCKATYAFREPGWADSPAPSTVNRSRTGEEDEEKSIAATKVRSFKDDCDDRSAWLLTSMMESLQMFDEIEADLAVIRTDEHTPSPTSSRFRTVKNELRRLFSARGG